jgi:hypothetical protein
MGEVVYMQAWKARRLLEQVTGEDWSRGTPIPTISSWVIPMSFSTDQLLILKLEGMVKTQKEILHTSRHVHVREEAAIKIGELKIQLARLRNKLENKDG